MCVTREIIGRSSPLRVLWKARNLRYSLKLKRAQTKKFQGTNLGHFQSTVMVIFALKWNEIFQSDALYCLMVTFHWKVATDRRWVVNGHVFGQIFLKQAKIGQKWAKKGLFRRNFEVNKYISTKYFIEVLKCRDDINIQIKMKTKIKSQIQII